MQEIVRFQELGNVRRFLYNEGEPFIYDETNSVVKRMGEIKYFVSPYVPLPEQMRTYPAKILTKWCQNWLDGNNDAKLS